MLLETLLSVRRKRSMRAESHMRLNRCVRPEGLHLLQVRDDAVSYIIAAVRLFRLTEATKHIVRNGSDWFQICLHVLNSRTPNAKNVESIQFLFYSMLESVIQFILNSSL